MRAAVLLNTGDEDLVLVDDIEVLPPGPTDVTIKIEATGVALATYVAPGVAHTIVREDDFYDMEVEGVRLVDFLATLVAGDVPADVRCSVCN